MILHSSDYNLKFICPNTLKYKLRYSEFISEVSSFKFDASSIEDFYKIAEPNNKLSAFSSFLVFNVLFNFLQTKIVIKKDIEDYYNSEMLKFLKDIKHTSKFQLKSLALTWNSLSKTLDLFLKEAQSYESIKVDYKVHWTDSIDNFYERVPLIGINSDDSIDIFLILHTSFEKYPLYSNPIDYLRIPSNFRILNYFLAEGLTVKDLKILWIDSSDINQKFKFSIYKGISKEDVKSYIADNSNLSNFKFNSSYEYNNLKQCYICPFFVQCSSSKSLLESTRKNWAPNNKTSNYEIML